MVVISGFSCYMVDPRLADRVAIPGDEPAYQLAPDAPPPSDLSFARVNSPTQFHRSQENLTLAGQIDVYKRAHSHLEGLIKSGVYTRKADPVVYIYRCITKSHTQTGIMCCVDSQEYEDGYFLPNESTLPDKVDSIILATQHIGIYTGFPMGFSHFPTELLDAMREVCAGEEPVLEVSKDGSVHQVFPTTLGQTAAIVKLVGRIPYFCIADGHHRMKAYTKMIDELKGRKRPQDFIADYNLIPVIVFPEEQLKVLKFNRVVTQVKDLGDYALLERLSQAFDIAEIDVSRLSKGEEGFEARFDELVAPRQRGEFAFYFASTDRWFRLTAHKRNGAHPMESIDTWYLSQHFFTEVLGIEDVSTSRVIKYVPENAGSIYNAELECKKKQHRVLVICKQLDVQDIERVSKLREIMPPKSTLFYPKPLIGLVFRELRNFG